MNEKNNKAVITMAIYKFSGYGMNVESYPIVNETDKSYMVLKAGIKSRIPKEEVGKVIHHMSDFCPYIRAYLYNATEEDAKETLVKWFENEIKYIRR